MPKLLSEGINLIRNRKSWCNFHIIWRVHS